MAVFGSGMLLTSRHAGKIKSAAILSLHLKTAQVQNGRPDGNRAPQAPTDAPMRPLGTVTYPL